MKRDPDLDRLASLIGEAERIVFFTGAGISTESGIPDYRSPGGLWTKQQPIYFNDFVSSAAVRREAWGRRFNDGKDLLSTAKPNAGHMAIAQLVRDGRASIITQNVDNLHQDSGVPADRIVELHGNATYCRCLDCARRFELGYVRQTFVASGEPPPCDNCGGIIKSATISFGQAMPEAEMERARAETLTCDLFVVVGSSLVVYPAAGFPMLAKRNGARLVILNRDPTEQDAIADLVLNREIGPTLSAVVLKDA